MILKSAAASVFLIALASFQLEKTHAGVTKDKRYNVLWLLLDDVSTERFPEYGNEALKDKLPGLQQLKDDGAVYYPHFYSPSSLCAPSQVGLFSSIEPGDIGGQYQFSSDVLMNKAPYLTVPPPSVEFVPEKLRSMGYWAAAGGKLDYQVGEVIPTFYNKILGNAFSDISSYQNYIWDPAISIGRPFFGMLNAMDFHQFLSTCFTETPITVTNVSGGTPSLPFGRYGYATPRSFLYPTGENGTHQWQPVVDTNLLEVDIVGYGGSFDENSISQANGGVPGYLPDDIGIKSILSREYDLIRNVDYKIEGIIKALKARGVYDDTLIMIFGDHGSGTYKGKMLMQPQSLRTPCWIKYPAGVELHAAVKVHQEGYRYDDRMAGMIDLYPTTLSVLGVEPESWMTGVALAGKYAVEETRDVMFGIIQRMLSATAYKTFAAFTKEHFYQRSLVTTEALFLYSLTLEEDIREEYMRAIAGHSVRENFYESSSAAPIFDRVRRLILSNARNQTYLEKYAFLAADNSRSPAELFYDLGDDPYGTKNLIYDYKYILNTGNETYPWGNDVESITLEYIPLGKSRLSPIQSTALVELSSALDDWIETQEWVSPTVNFNEYGFAEENAMASVFWPGGVEPLTADVQVDSVIADPRGVGMAKAKLDAPTPGTVIRYAVTTPAGEARCEQLGFDVKQSIPLMTITNCGVPPSDYVSVINQRAYKGYRYGPGTPYQAELINFVGSRPDCTFFVSDDATFFESNCPGFGTIFFDTRDSTWNGTHWVGVNPATGAWLGPPVTFWDTETNAVNYYAFGPYVYGPERDQIYSGMNPDGTPYVASTPYNFPLNRGFKPAPKYWGSDVPVAVYIAGAVTLAGWNLVPQETYFLPVDVPGGEQKGSFQYAHRIRMVTPPRFSLQYIKFSSFNYECLFWEVGTEAKLNFTDTDELVIYMQGVRKGYHDSKFTRTVVQASDVEDMCLGVEEFELWDPVNNVLIGPLGNEIDLSAYDEDALLTITPVTLCTDLDVTLTMMDGDGNVITSFKLPTLIDGAKGYSITVSQLPPGNYVIEAKPPSGVPLQTDFSVLPKKKDTCPQGPVARSFCLTEG